MASVMRALPPSATGQPTPCASAISIIPTAPVGGAVNGIIPCAATPANSARASGVQNRRATPAADLSPLSPNTAIPADRRDGGRRIGDKSRSLNPA
jgi:hypothetical protein